MPVTVDIRQDLAGIADRIGLLAEKRMAAASAAINKTLTTVRKEAVAASGPLASELPGLRIGAIRKRVRLTRATRDLPAGALTFSKSRLRLTNFALRLSQTKYGTAVAIPARLAERVISILDRDAEPASAAEIRRAFIQRSRRNGVVNVWVRFGKKSYPIGLLAVPSLSEILASKRLNASFARRARERFAVVFAQEAAFRLSKR